eukprot:194960-Chlamydomonas_euryale.AAC.5
MTHPQPALEPVVPAGDSPLAAIAPAASRGGARQAREGVRRCYKVEVVVVVRGAEVGSCGNAHARLRSGGCSVAAGTRLARASRPELPRGHF